jgi:hypothetical protein
MDTVSKRPPSIFLNIDGKRIETFPHKIENLIYEEPQKSVEYKKCQIKVNNFVLDVYVHHQDLERLFNYLQEEYDDRK